MSKEFTPKKITENPVKTYSPEKYHPVHERKKEFGRTKGEFLTSIGKSGKEKLWMKKETMIQSFLTVANSKTAEYEPMVEAIGDIVNTIYCHYRTFDEEQIKTGNFIKIFEKITELKKQFRKEYELESPDSTNEARRQKKLGELCQQVTEIFDANIRPLLGHVILHEKINEVLGGVTNAFLSESPSTPKTREVYMPQDRSFFSISAFATTPDAYDFLIGIPEKKAIDETKSAANIDRSTIQKPIKGLYEAIIIRLFLMDNSFDIKLENMLVIDRGNHYRIENIDFGNSFHTDHRHWIEKNGFTNRTLLWMINEVDKDLRKKDRKLYDFLKNHIEKEAAKEIEATLKKIASLSDRELDSLTRTMFAMNKECELVTEETRMKYLTLLKGNRDLFAAQYQKLTGKNVNCEEEKKDSPVSTLSPNAALSVSQTPVSTNLAESSPKSTTSESSSDDSTKPLLKVPATPSPNVIPAVAHKALVTATQPSTATL